jgi:pimeloyl-ACP methyl ester carboxylesterase
VIGFLGGWERWDNPKRSVRKLALRLREKRLPGFFVETAGNHSRKTVRQFLHQALDANRDGKLQPEEAAAARIVLYGQSFGGAATVKLARELARWNVPVLLTVQVDSVGRDDHLIPPNVKRAMNFYQRDPGPLRGEDEIRAADPSRTGILGNQRFTYLFRRDIDLSDYPRLARAAPIAHWRMDNDPVVWGLVEALILAEYARQAPAAGLP